MATRAEIEDGFPALKGTNWQQTSHPDPGYNCHAYAVGLSTRFLAPPPHPFAPLVRYYWPLDAPTGKDVAAFASAYTFLGFSTCESPVLEPGVEKIALYERNGLCTHTARQLESGEWTSKLGKEMDISHPLDGLNDVPSFRSSTRKRGDYGRPVYFMSRPRPE